MIDLLVHGGDIAPDAASRRTGGVPLAPAGFAWPTCAGCDGAMQFIAHLPLGSAADADAVSVFMCQNDPGLCDEWDPDGGGNRAVVVSGALVPLEPPAAGETALGAVSALRVETVAEPTYREARAAWAERAGVGLRQVVGVLGGEPEWIQGDETPACEGCAGPMPFVALLEEGADHRTGANYGGGAAYVFACGTHASAAFLWQQ